jgi:hypothetical protein
MVMIQVIGFQVVTLCSELKCCLPIEVPDARLGVFMVMKIQAGVFWIVMLCTLCHYPEECDLDQEYQKPDRCSSCFSAP